MNIEDLIRAAQERQADRAVPAERIRAALPRRVARAARQRRYGAVVAAAAVAAAITVPALALHPAGPPAAPAGHAAAAAPSPTTSSAAGGKFALGYRPTWAPPGFAEHIRTADTGAQDPGFGPTVARVWKKQVGAGDPWGGAELMLQVRTAVPDPASAMGGGTAVDINGTPGHYVGGKGDKKSYVYWTPGAHTVLSLNASHLDIGQADLLRMARSVRPDPATEVIPVRLGWLPAGWAADYLSVSGPSTSRWRSEVIVTPPAPSASAKAKGSLEGKTPSELTVIVGSTTDAPPGGDTRTVGGHPARHPVRPDAAGQSLLYLVVDLGQGRLMTLIASGGLSLTDLSKVAERATITPADLGWLG